MSTSVLVDKKAGEAIESVFVTFASVFVFFFTVAWTLILYLIAVGVKNKVFYIIVLLWFTYCIISNTVYTIKYMIEGEPYAPTLTALVPEAIVAYLVYRGYSVLPTVPQISMGNNKNKKPNKV